ncbi:hypothetical protein [Actinomadura madurae]|uniref:hypothetical protein n=1 Tax=Actinomadura madurae TaxID=1993 RepID=UPI0020D24AA8|nr:hypothetical protein [Actinomadura madurae]MCQ0019513.1 hypothetical protein [Actinomadura madurae]
MAAVLADDPDPLQHAGPLTPVLQGLLRKDPGQRMEPDEAGRLLRQIAQAGPRWAPPAAAPAAAPSSAPPHDVTLQSPAAPTIATPVTPPRRKRRVPWWLVVPGGIFTAALVAAVLAIVVFVDSGSDAPSSGESSSSRPRAWVPGGYEPYRGRPSRRPSPRAGRRSRPVTT